MAWSVRTLEWDHYVLASDWCLSRFQTAESLAMRMIFLEIFRR